MTFEACLPNILEYLDAILKKKQSKSCTYYLCLILYFENKIVHTFWYSFLNTSEKAQIRDTENTLKS